MLGSAFAGGQPRLPELPCLALGAHGGPPGGAAVAAVAAAASAAAAAAAAAVVAAAGEHVQAQLQARRPRAPAVHAVHALARLRAVLSPGARAEACLVSGQAKDSVLCDNCRLQAGVLLHCLRLCLLRDVYGIGFRIRRVVCAFCPAERGPAGIEVPALLALVYVALWLQRIFKWK